MAISTNPDVGGETGVLNELEAAWRRTDELFAIIGDAWLERSIPLRHPFLFYLGHLPAFAWNQLARGVLGKDSFNAHFDDLFERGIDPLDVAEAERVAIHDWPSVPETMAYRDRVRDELRAALGEVRERAGGDVLAEGLRIYHLVLEHELMHHETLFYLLHELDPELKVRPPGAPEPILGATPASSDRVSIPAGTVTLGAEFGAVRFGWDNEFPQHRVAVEAFRLDRLPVTIADYRKFVDAGGYGESSWWATADWAWLQSAGITAPQQWRLQDGTWRRRTFFGWAALDDVSAWPVQVSGAEAEAYCRWIGARLPSEPELQWAAYGTPDGSERSYPWGEEPPSAHHGNFDFHNFDPVPVGSHPAGRSAFGVDELVGNGWEWTSTDFAPFEGFVPWARTYPGYSADFFTGKHAIVFGGCWATSARLLRASFRNWFQRQYRYVPATFRCAW